MRRPAALAAALVGLGAATALAGPVRMTNTTTAQYRLYRFVQGERQGEEVPYGLLLDRLNLVAAADGFDAAARIDGMLFFDPPEPQTGEFRDDARIERLTAGYRLDIGQSDVGLKIGDFYRQLGRGILLSLRKEDEIGVDIALRGGELAVLGESLDVTLFAGRTNPVNLDNVSEKFVGPTTGGAATAQRFIGEPGDVVAGGEAKLRGLGPLQIAAHGVYVGADYQTASAEVEARVVGVGGAMQVPDLLEVGSLYVEVDWLRNQREDRLFVGRTSNTSADGLAAYGTLELFLGDVGVVAEGLYLDQFDVNGGPNQALERPFTYNQPPTVERIDQEVLNNRNVLGGRLRLDYVLLDGDMTVYGNGMLRLSDPGLESEVTAVHAYGGFELSYDRGRSRLSASGGWRDEDLTGGAAASDLKSMVHGEGEWLHAFAAWALSLSTLNELRTLDAPTGVTEYVRGSTLVGVEFGHSAGWMKGFAEKLSLTFELGYDDQDQSADARTLYYAGIVDWTLDARLRVRALAGTQRGGLKCIGGVCRIFPEFAGGRLDIITTLDL